MRKLEYTILGSYSLLTRDTHDYGFSANSGRDDRQLYILEVEDGNSTYYVVYDESVYSFECTKNIEGYNTIYVGEGYIEFPSHTNDYHRTVYSNYEEALNDIKRIEEFEYYLVIED